jgi:hypothetical protein
MYLAIAVAILVILNVVFMLLAYLNNVPRRDKQRFR